MTHDDGSVSNHPESHVRRFIGPEATEIFAVCTPASMDGASAAAQTEAVYRQLQGLLAAEGGALKHVIRETVFFRDIRRDLPQFQASRDRVFDAVGCHSCRPASTYIEQPPVNEGERVVLSAFAILPHRRGTPFTRTSWGRSPCGCDDCTSFPARLVDLAGQAHLYAGNVHGANGSAYDEAFSMFEAAQELLREEGLSFRDVLRTWIYVRDIEQDYGELNRARTAFFQHAEVTLYPASTGIQGAPFPNGHRFSLGVYAIGRERPPAVRRMSTATLNEAWMYGSDFSRGLEVVDANKVALYLSGTASVDEEGRTAHVGAFAEQVDRMLLNVSSLLDAHGASFDDLLSTVTYLRSKADAPLLIEILSRHGLGDLPNVVVQAPVCRPDLLCEMEGIAVLPRDGCVREP